MKLRLNDRREILLWPIWRWRILVPQAQDDSNLSPFITLPSAHQPVGLVLTSRQGQACPTDATCVQERECGGVQAWPIPVGIKPHQLWPEHALLLAHQDHTYQGGVRGKLPYLGSMPLPGQIVMSSCDIHNVMCWLVGLHTGSSTAALVIQVCCKSNALHIGKGGSVGRLSSKLGPPDAQPSNLYHEQLGRADVTVIPGVH